MIPTHAFGRIIPLDSDPCFWLHSWPNDYRGKGWGGGLGEARQQRVHIKNIKRSRESFVSKAKKPSVKAERGRKQKGCNKMSHKEANRGGFRTKTG
ncbi:hypothetical protein OPV22_023307 [Ensete ventricosum]|uniref:Uncharacterized protein n=1 Tax=Ensete ventricosum TaxID=4639 RepID=A0AAV8QN79_ENSVE|nr:hypothetical protein OPV22_023307 [Ensete ventricosum]